MNFAEELKKKNMNIRTCSQKSGIPYATLYPIVKGQVDVGTCSYYTVKKLADSLGYRPDQIVYEEESFQNFRNNLHHKLKANCLETILEIIENEIVEYYERHGDYVKMFYLVATVDFISKKYKIPLCDKYNKIRNKKLEEPFYVGDSLLIKNKKNSSIEEFARFNIYEGDLFDAV